MTDAQTIDVLIQGGAVGLALVALLLVGYTIKILTNHLAHVGVILTDLAVNIKELGTIVKMK